MKEVILLMEDAFRWLSAGLASAPLRTRIDLPGEGNDLLVMPCSLPATNTWGVKTVAVHPHQKSLGKASVHASYLLGDSETGEPLATFEAEHLTALRTGAASGLATQLLGIEQAETAVIFGAGTQARTQLAAVCAVRPITQAIVVNRNRDRAQHFASEMSAALGINVLPGKPSEVSKADVICTATASTTPLFDDALLKPHCHLNLVGSYRPDMIEAPASTIQRATVIVDDREATQKEAGDLMQVADLKVYHELGGLLNEQIDTTSLQSNLTVFKSVGHAVQDLVLASAIFRKME